MIDLDKIAGELELPEVITIPGDDSLELLGIKPLVISYDDVTNDYSWYKLVVRHDTNMDEWEFCDRELYEKYWFISSGLLEFPLMFIGGELGGGKSMFMAYYTHKLIKLFDKKGTLDWTPRDPEAFGHYNNLFDEDYQEKIIDEYNRLARIERDTKQEIPLEERQKLLTFNAVYGLDECDSYADRQNQTNLTKLLAMIYRRSRHTYTCMAMVMRDITRFAPVLAELHTHRVMCIKNGHFPGKCSILIEDVRKGGTRSRKWLFLDPKEWLHLWRSYNIPPLVHNVNISFGRQKPKKGD